MLDLSKEIMGITLIGIYIFFPQDIGTLGIKHILFINLVLSQTYFSLTHQVLWYVWKEKENTKTLGSVPRLDFTFLSFLYLFLHPVERSGEDRAKAQQSTKERLKWCSNWNRINQCTRYRIKNIFENGRK